MGFPLSPIVDVNEKDLTTSVPAVATSIGATVGTFSWGPVEEVILADSEAKLVQIFGKPNDLNYKDWFSAANFLAYSNNLKTVRVIGTGALNAADNGTGVVIKNLAHFESTKAALTTNFYAKYPGARGDNITVDVATATSYGTGKVLVSGVIGAFSVGETITGGTSAATAVVASVGTGFITVNTIVGTFTAGETITGGTSAATATLDSIAWAYASSFDYTPTGTDIFVVVLENGVEVEKFMTDSSATAKNFQGDSLFIEEVLARKSAFVWCANGGTVTGTTYTLSGGADDTIATVPNQAAYEAGWNLFADSDAIDINLAFIGGAIAAVGKYVVQQIAEVRKDCVAFLSPGEADVVGVIDPTASLIALRNGAYNFSSSYAFIDGNYKNQYDRYNDVYRWVPLNGDIAGLCARTDDVADPWFSPGGFNRGQIKNVNKLAFNPSLAQRDELYKNNLNPVVTFYGEGTVLYGDKTAQTKPSAFDHINVRRLFIVLEKAIATAAKYSLFEMNDAFTRARFVQMVEPFLRTVQGRRGIYDFRVICDETNNTGEVIDANQFVGDIYIKPARAINYISLNFVAVKTAVDFNEVIG